MKYEYWTSRFRRDVFNEKLLDEMGTQGWKLCAWFLDGEGAERIAFIRPVFSAEPKPTPAAALADPATAPAPIKEGIYSNEIPIPPQPIIVPIPEDFTERVEFAARSNWPPGRLKVTRQRMYETPSGALYPLLTLEDGSVIDQHGNSAQEPPSNFKLLQDLAPPENPGAEWYNTLNRIGVFDYPSCQACLQSNWKQVFPGEPYRDPQDAIQRMAAEIQRLRRAPL